jgi:hypothetical protein
LSGVYQGLSFETLRTALTAIYWYDPEVTDGSWIKNNRYVVPRQHNWTNPVDEDEKGGYAKDTYIQYWIDSDDRIGEDYNEGEYEAVQKAADISLRFIGARAEQWAKAFHHLARRTVVGEILHDFCNGGMLDYIRPIIPMNIDYFKTGNSVIAFDTGFTLHYVEYMDLSDLRQPLQYVSVAPGSIT